MTDRLKIVIIGSSRYPIAQPFAGGLEAHICQLTRTLSSRGHDITLFAAPGSDPSVARRSLTTRTIELSEASRRDVSNAPDIRLDEHHAYLSLMLELGDRSADQFDLVHNHSLHYLPVALARLVAAPMVTTLHTPPVPFLESALRVEGAPRCTLAAVSQYTASQWSHVEPTITVVPNGVDLTRWLVGPGGDDWIWFGRLVAEKGPHLAVAAARAAGRRLRLAGPIVDRPYFEEFVAPHLDDDISYLGHLDHTRLAAEVGRSAAALVTPMWDEPYGLVVAEALACGTPVAAFARGGIPEILDDDCGRLAPGGDVAALAEAAEQASGLSRAACRRRAETFCSVDAMADRYEALYAGMIAAAR